MNLPPIQWKDGRYRLSLRPGQIVRNGFLGELADLGPDDWIVDLGSGPGTFDYQLTRARVLAIDLGFSRRIPSAAGCVIADAGALPLRSDSMELLMCNNSLEHFEGLEASLSEISRVTRPSGHLWGAVPDTEMLDDRLYRFLYKGGGHVNPFSLHSFVERIEKGTGFVARKYQPLYSGFVYLNSDSIGDWLHLPRRMQLIFVCLAPATLESCRRWLAYLTRRLDGWFGTTFSQYGWGVLFAKNRAVVQPNGDGMEMVPSESDVCSGCGIAHDRAFLGEIADFSTWPPVYFCPCCGTKGFLPRK